MKTTRPQPTTPEPPKRERGRTPEASKDPDREAREEARRRRAPEGDAAEDAEVPIADELRQHPGS